MCVLGPLQFVYSQKLSKAVTSFDSLTKTELVYCHSERLCQSVSLFMGVDGHQCCSLTAELKIPSIPY